MKILMLADLSFPPDARIYKEATALIKDGHDVHLLCLKGKGNRADGICIHRFPFGESKLPAPINWMVDYSLYTLFASIYVPLYSIFRGYDVIHVHNPPDFVVPFLCWLRLLGKTILFDVHDPTPLLAMSRMGASERNPVIRLLGFFFSAAIKCSSHVVTISEPVARIIKQSGKTATIVKNCPDDTFFMHKASRKPSANTIAYCGAMVPKRGLELLIEAFRVVERSNPRAKLLMIGGGEALDALKELARGHNVVFTGQVPYKKVPQMLDEVAIAVVPFEPTPINAIGSPNKIYEYMALGKTIVSIDNPGTRAIGKSAVIYCSYDVVEMAKALKKAINTSLGKKARAIAKSSYKWENAKKPLLDLYKSFE